MKTKEVWGQDSGKLVKYWTQERKPTKGKGKERPTETIKLREWDTPIAEKTSRGILAVEDGTEW